MYVNIVFLAILILVVIIFYSTTLLTEIRLKNNVITSQILNQANNRISSIIEEAEYIGTVFAFSTNIHQILKNTILDYQQVVEYKEVLNELDHIENNRFIYSLRFFIQRKKLYLNEKEVIFPISYITENEYFKSEISDIRNNFFWLSDHEVNKNGVDTRLISFYSVIRSYENPGEILGCLRLDVLNNTIYEILNSINISGEESAYLLNENLEVLCAGKNSEINRKVLEVAIEGYENEGNRIVEVDGKKYSCTFNQLVSNRWSIAYIIPETEIYRDINKLARRFLIIIILFFLVSFIFIYFISTFLSGKIVSISKSIKLFYQSHHNPVPGAYSKKNEVSILEASFDDMTFRIEDLIEKQYEAEIRKKEDSLNILQQQINPHFLYNVFDTINWLAIRAKADNVVEILSKISRYYRLSLTDGEYIVTLKKEIEHVELYLLIQKYMSDFTYSIEIPEEIFACQVVKHLLQPIIENAFMHGIHQKPEDGILKISGSFKNDVCIIQVMDNACLLDCERVIRQMKLQSDSKHYGLKNVDERIKLYFGDDFGLSFKRSEKWSIVEIVLPKTV